MAKRSTSKPALSKAEGPPTRSTSKAISTKKAPTPKAGYVDGFVIPLPMKNIAAYKRMATRAAKVWMEHGALEYRECIGEDLQHEGSAIMSFPKQLRTKPGETVVFSWITYRSRKHRDQVNAKVLSDPRILKMMEEKNEPFDSKRMVFGGFGVLLAV